MDWFLADEGDMSSSSKKELKEKLDPNIYEVMNILKKNKGMAKTLKQILASKESIQVLEVVNLLPDNKRKAMIEMFR